MLIDHYGLTLTSRRRRRADAGADRGAAGGGAAARRGAARALRRRGRGRCSQAQPGHIDDALEFASRAWRRPLTAAEKASLRRFYDTARAANKLDHDGGIRARWSRASSSRRRSSIASSRSPRGREKPLNDWELASRLSFFLWSSIPDDELRRAPRRRELRDPALLTAAGRAHDRRPQGSPPRDRVLRPVARLLSLRPVSRRRHRALPRVHRTTSSAAMYDEAISTFEYIVRQSRPVKEILTPTTRSSTRRSRSSTGIDRPRSRRPSTVERVDGASAINRGGALRLGSVLTTTSAPLRTSPVKRGDWVLRRILGTPTPPPPADAGNIPADDQDLQRPDAAAAARAAQAQRDLRQLPPAHRPARLPARRLRRRRPDAADVCRRPAGRRHRRVRATRRRSSAPTACWTTCSRQDQQGHDDAVAEDARLRARPHRAGLGSAAARAR